MHKTSRRKLLMILGYGATLSLLPACVSTREGKVTTATIDVARVKLYIDAGLNAATIVQDIIALIPGLLPYSEALDAAMGILENANTAFKVVAKDKLVLTYDDTSVKTVMLSIHTALEDLYQFVIAMITEMDKHKTIVSVSSLNKIRTVHDALSIVVGMVNMIMAPFLPSSIVLIKPRTLPNNMSEPQALRILQA